MHKVFLRLGTMGVVFTLPLSAAIWSGCSSSDDPATTPTPDAAPEAAPDAYVAPVDAAVEAAAPGRDCAADLQADGLQQHLDCTGLYSSFTTKTVAADNKPYTPGVTFWSDGAEKSRFLYLPPGTKIDIANFDEWKFPNGTKVWKEFRLDGKRIETRLFQKAKDAWQHTTYRWNDAETDAVRKDGGEKVPIAGKSVMYEVPNTGQCDGCHMGKTDSLLGVEAIGLGLPTAQGVTLASLAADGRFSVAPPMTTITIPDDGSGTSAPALGWLHANCGACHNSGSGAAMFTGQWLQLRPSQLYPEAGVATVQDLDTWKTAVNINSSRTDVDAGVPYKRIVGGDAAHSLMSILSGRRAVSPEEPNPIIQMPPLVTRQVDVAGHALLDAWIAVIPP